MKQIKLIIAAAALTGLIASCQKDFTVQTGNTPVEFVYSSIDTVLNSAMNYIPVQMTEQATPSSFTTVEFLGGTIIMKEDNSTVEIVDGTHVIFTSKELYIGAYDPEVDTADLLPTNNIEFRIPDYLNYQEVTFSLRLTGQYLGSVTEMTWKATAPADVDMTGTWVIGTAEFQISVDENGNYSVVDPFFGDTWSASRAGSVLTFNSTSGNTFNVGDPHGDVTATFCAYHPEDGTEEPTYLWPDEPCVWEFTSGTVTVTNGVFIGFESPADGKWYSWNGSSIAAGTTGNKK